MSDAEQASERTPTLPEVIQAGLDAEMVHLHTAMPGTVVSFDPAKGTASVRPAFKRRLELQDSPVDLPIIPSVPVLCYGTASSWVRVPLAAGDEVLLVFAERSLERWLEQGGQVDPADARRHALADAVAIPGSMRRAPRPLGSQDSLEVVHGRARLELTKDGKVKLGNDFAELIGTLDTILGHLIGLSTTNAAIGVPCALSPATIAQLTADQLLLQRMKG